MPSATSGAVPVRFRDRLLDDYRPTTISATTALAAASRVVSGEIRNLVLTGPTGVGKTHLAAGISHAISDLRRAEYEGLVAAREADPDGRYPRPWDAPTWVNVADAIVRMRLEFDRPLADRTITNLVLSLHYDRGLVVLDDLGREKTSDWTGEVVFALVNARYEAMLSTVVTTNLTSTELAESRYWPVISRLAEDGDLVRIDAPDRRLTR